MKKKDIEFFKELLTNRLEELLNHADDTVSGMTTQKENFPDPTDRASLEAERNFMLRIRDRENKLIKKAAWFFSAYSNSGCGIDLVSRLAKSAFLSTRACPSAAPAIAPRGPPSSIPNDPNVSFPNQPIDILL